MLFEALSGGVSAVNFIIFSISAVVVIFLTLPIHEWAHAFTATKLGDPTPKYTGRLSLNPFAHIDYVGALMLIVFGFGWAKPVRVDARYFKKPKRDMAITAAAGPISNICVAFLGIIILNILQIIYRYVHSDILLYIAVFFNYVSVINIGLAAFNLIPFPPLDGSRILALVLPNKIYYKMMNYERFVFIAFIILFYTGILTVPLNYISNLIYDGLSYVASLPFKLIFN